MTPRQRYAATFNFASPDRVPFQPGFGRNSTRAAWLKQGLPEDVTDIIGHVRELIGLPPEPVMESFPLEEAFRMQPHFEEKIIERRPAPSPSMRGTLVVQDWKGNICEISDEFDPTYLRNPVDFVTRSWIRCPVESREEWTEMKRRYDPDNPDRLPDNFTIRAAQLRERSGVLGINISGPFWQLREWLGFENLCMIMLDDPDFVPGTLIGTGAEVRGSFIVGWAVPVSVRVGYGFALKGDPGYALGDPGGFYAWLGGSF